MKTKSSKPNHKFKMTNHLCRHCGTGTILIIVDGGPSAGGNESYMCSNCLESSFHTPSNICYCGFLGPNRDLPYGTFACFRRENQLDPEGWRTWKLTPSLGVFKRNLDPK